MGLQWLLRSFCTIALVKYAILKYSNGLFILNPSTVNTKKKKKKTTSYCKTTGQRVVIAYESSKCSGKPAHPRSLARTYAVR